MEIAFFRFSGIQITDGGFPMEDMFLKFVIIQLGNEEYGLPIEQVQSIEKMQTVTPLPQTPEHMRGIVYLREAVVPVVDLKCHFTDEKSESTEQTRIVTIQEEDHMVGLIVDKAVEILDIPEGQIQNIEDEAADAKGMLQVAHINDRLVLCLDVQTLLKDVDPSGKLKTLKEAI